MTSADDFMDNREDAPPPGVSGPETYAMVQRCKEVVWSHDTAAARSQQKAAGPSEIGNECERRLAYKSIGFGQVNHEHDHWAAIKGTAVHAWLARAFERADNGTGRYLIEFKTYITLPSGLVIPGHLDVYDRVLHEVIDHKVVGAKSATKYRRYGSPIGYRVQGDIYAKGMEQQGETPRRVGQMYYPIEGNLDGAFGYSEPYQPRRAERAAERYEWIRNRATEVTNDGANPENVKVFPKTPSMLCGWCPYYLAKSPSSGKGCSGKGEDA